MDDTKYTPDNVQTSRVPTQTCLECGTELDAATGFAKPSPGDVIICIQCGHLMAFDENLNHRPLTDKEMHMVAGDRRVLGMQAARAAYLESKKSKPG